MSGISEEQWKRFSDAVKNETVNNEFCLIDTKIGKKIVFKLYTSREELEEHLKKEEDIHE